MGELPLGRIAGIRIRMSWSVLVVAAVYTSILATNRFPIEQPGLSSSAYWIAGVVGALLFFASLLAHELGHALVARHEGVGVSAVSLWLLGGLAHLESSPPTPRAELRIAGIGPLTSAACGGVFLGVGAVLGHQGGYGLAAHMFGWLGFVNLLLAGFNMIPAAPLDGGNVLAALLWMRSGRRAGAIAATARLGLAFGGVLVLVGVANLHSGSDYGLWLLVVGAFILLTAWQQLGSTTLISALDGVVVADGMHPSPPVTYGQTTIDGFLRTLGPTTHQAYPVLGPDGQVHAMLTADAIRAVPRERWATLRVDELAIPLDRVTVVGAREPLLQASQKLRGGAASEALVVDEHGRVVGTLNGEAIHWALQQRRSAPV